MAGLEEDLEEGLNHFSFSVKPSLCLAALVLTYLSNEFVSENNF